MTRLIVAAGGGGDAVAAVMVGRALYGDRDPVVILTHAWEGPWGDAAPGWRGWAGFAGLRALVPGVPGVFVVTGEAGAAGPADPALSRLAGEIAQTVALMEARHGVRGAVARLEALVRGLDPESVDLLDVGGGTLAGGGEGAWGYEELGGPPADAFALAACWQVDFPVRLLVAGPGLDGAPTAGEVRGLLGRNVLTLTPEDVEPVAHVLDWHPSETTALLAAAAREVRGLCETRGAGPPVPLTDEGPTVHEADLDEALARNRLARAVCATDTFEEVARLGREFRGMPGAEARGGAGRGDGGEERATRRVAGTERPGAEHPRTAEPVRTAGSWREPGTGTRPDDASAEPGPAPGPALDAITAFERRARARGVSHVTFDCLAEVAGLGGSGGRRREELRVLLIAGRPEQYVAPLWHISPPA